MIFTAGLMTLLIGYGIVFYFSIMDLYASRTLQNFFCAAVLAGASMILVSVAIFIVPIILQVMP